MSDKKGGGHSGEIASGKRFAFGKNWRSFLDTLDEGRIGDAISSIRKLTGLDSLEGMSVVDVGSGSGLFSLAAMRLGAAEVLSFDYDPDSVRCGLELKERFFPGDERWRIIEGSVLDERFLQSIATFDIVYSWGVLHHTGDLWRALCNTGALVGPGGLLAIAIYNDQGLQSRVWRWIKKCWCRTPQALRPFLFFPIPLAYELRWAAVDLLFRGRSPLHRWRSQGRGMNPWHDWIDWLGGYPFEVAKPEALFSFFREIGFSLERMTTRGGEWGNNELVFRRG